MAKKTIYLKVKMKYLSSFHKFYQCEIKLQTKIQITQQHNKSKLKKYWQNKRNNYQGENIVMVTSKEDRKKNKLNKNCSKFTSKGTDIVSVPLLQTLSNARPRHMFTI